jgi:hypothetical protein
MANRDRTREDLAEEMRVLAHMATARLHELIPVMEARDAVLALTVTADKSELMSGNATGRTEVVSITSGFDDHERQTLHDAIAAELERREVEA